MFTIRRSRLGSGSLGSCVSVIVGSSFLVGGEVALGFFGLGGEFMIGVRAVRYCTYAEFLEREIILVKN